jgi:hypothetical protein
MLFVGGGLYCFAAFICYGALALRRVRLEPNVEALQGGGGALLGAGASLVSIATMWIFLFHR